MDCVARLIMMEACSDADENKSKCVNMDETAAKTSGWTN
jgi:hypothetical protein